MALSPHIILLLVTLFYDDIRKAACGKQTTVLYGVIDFLGTESDKIETSLNLEPDEVLNLANEFNKKSELYINTGGVHSCALCNRQGIILFEEDVG
ncbi:MAG: hypothetical protein FIA99_18655 [Ruminiclostridium sp.]|nr:hypothetical protein [Ruminiclostridium sp.]